MQIEDRIRPGDAGEGRMSRRTSWRRRGVRILGAAALAALPAASPAWAGDHPPAEPVLPLGAALHRIMNAQAEAAAQDQFTFYECEWAKNSPHLGPAGRVHL